MKINFVYGLICLFFLPSLSHASDDCYEFDVGAFSKGLHVIEVTVAPQKSSAKRFTAKIVARKAKGRFTATEFACTKGVAKLSCVQAEGAGDFQLSDVKNIPTLKLSYVNLLIGSTGSVVVKGNAEINEEFAIYDLKNGDETESEDETGELSSVLITGQRVACRADS